MTYFRMPIFVWTAFATAIIGLTATQLIGLSFQMVLFERLFGMGFFTPDKGGNPILFQHLFWFYSHPAVYVFVLTGLGVICELLPVFCPQAAVWLSLGGAVLFRHRPGWLPGLGAPHVHQWYGVLPARPVHVQHTAGRRADRGQVLQLDCNPLGRQALLRDARCCSCWEPSRYSCWAV